MALTKVQTNAIEDDAVTTDKLANAINTERTANTAKVSLENNSVTLAKMAGGTDGQIITYDANGDPLAVGPGTDGQVLTSTGAGSPPAFEDAAAGGASLSGSTNNTVTTVTGANAITGDIFSASPSKYNFKKWLFLNFDFVVLYHSNIDFFVNNFTSYALIDLWTSVGLILLLTKVLAKVKLLKLSPIKHIFIFKF